MNTSRGFRRPLSGFVGAVWFIMAVPAGAQLPRLSDQIAALGKSRPVPSQQVIARLGELGRLPAGEWRMHAGDVAHGEDPQLDDSHWPQVTRGSRTGFDAAWYRSRIEVPKNLNGYDLTGARVWFRFRASADGPIPQIVYFNGRRVALGDDLEPIVLFDKARSGDSVLVAVKLQHTVAEKVFRGVDLNIEFAADRPSPKDLREEFLATAALLPGLSKNLAADQATLDKAIATVSLPALSAHDQGRFDASMNSAEAALAALKPLVREVTFHETGNSHIDAAWLWPWTETVDVVKRTFSTALQLMDEYPWYTYTQSAAAYNEWIATKYPAINERIKKRIKEGRWEIVGGMWVEPDLNLPDGESLARSLLIGKRFFRQEYGVEVRVGWNPDSFGYNWQLPQIYKKSGIDYFVTQKMAWNETNQLPFKLFWWESPDGSKVLTYFPHDYANTDLDPVRLSIDMATARTQAPGITEVMDLYGVGDHGGGPTRATLDEGAHWAAGDKMVANIKFGTASDYFGSIEKRLAPQSPSWDYDALARGYTPPPAPPDGQIAIPTMRSELYFEYHRGIFTTHAAHKRNMRESEQWTLDAEKYASLAWLDGRPYPADELTDAWKKVTFNDFHDLAAGSGIGVIYQEAQKDFDAVHWATDEIKRRSLDTLAARIDTGPLGSVPLLIVNPLAWQRSGLVELTVQMPAADAQGIAILDSHNRVLPQQILSVDRQINLYHLLVEARDVPSLGYEVVHAVRGARRFAGDIKVEGLTLENDALRVVVDRNSGCVTSIYAKKSNFESLAHGACGNELQAFKDTPKEYDAWNIDPGTLEAPIPLTHADSVEMIEKGPMRAVVRVTRTWQNSRFVQDITLYSGSDQVDVVNDIDWHETHILLKAAFPLAASSRKATYEIPYGTIDRPTTRNNSWEQAQFEVPALRWADLGDGEHGVSLINESKYGYDARGNVLRLSLLRSPTWPDSQADRGHHHFSYALRPHAGDWKEALTVRHGYEFNYPLSGMQVAPHTGPLPAEHAFVSITPENVVLTALKKAEEGDGLVLHLYEWAGRASTVEIAMPPGAASAIITDLMEKPVGAALAVANGHVSVPIKPYEILVVRFDYAH